MMVAPCCLPVSATTLALWSVISYWLRQNVVSKHPKTTSKDILYFSKSRPLTIHVQLEKFYQFCTFYCEPLATWYTFKYFDHIFDAFCEIKISGHFCRFHCEHLAFWQVQVSGSSCVAHPRDFYGGFSNLERLCDNKKRIFAAQKWGPTLKTFLSLETNKYLWSYHLIGQLILPS